MFKNQKPPELEIVRSGGFCVVNPAFYRIVPATLATICVG